MSTARTHDELPALPPGMRWSAERYTTHGGTQLPRPLPRLVDPDRADWEPPDCLKGVRIVMRPVGSCWVCPMCGLWASWAGRR